MLNLIAKNKTIAALNQSATAGQSPGLLELIGLLMAWFAIWGAAIYYFYALNSWSVWLAIIASLISLILFHIPLAKNYQTAGTDDKHTQTTKQSVRPLLPIFYVAPYLLLLLAAGALLLIARSPAAIISPWELLAPRFFLIYAAAGLNLILILNHPDIKSGYKLAGLSAYYFLTWSIAAFVYKISYGFDPLVHLAAMKTIAAEGFILPKTLYYTGQYGLISILNQLTALSLDVLNKFLLPILAALLLPSALKQFFQAYFKPPLTAPAWLALLFLLILTAPFFTFTTPQNLAYLFLILSILAGAGPGRRTPALIFALAGLACHPLAGLPALVWWLYLNYRLKREIFSGLQQKILSGLLFSGTVLILPLAMIIGAGAKFSPQPLVAITDGLRQLLAWPQTAGQENWLLNFIYLFAKNQNLLIVLFIIIAGGYLYRHYLRTATKEEKANPPLIALTNSLVIGLALSLSYLITLSLRFSEVIDYEKYAYADRLPLIIVILFLPGWLLGGRALIERIFIRPRLEKIFWLVLGLSLLSASLYLTYPRLDKYWNSRGYSTSAYDVATVLSVANDAQEPYLVLANQQVSTAALKEFGFQPYYQSPSGPLYFYPIPTGGPLYQYYLRMVYEAPERTLVRSALDLAGLDLGYFIINKYWRQSPQIINAAKLNADAWWEIEGEVYVFKYQF